VYQFVRFWSAVALPDSDGPLVLARRALGDAVHSLADPIPVWDHGVARWSDPVYVRLRSAITARTAGRRHVMSGSRAPCRTDVLVWLIDVDRAVAGWEPDTKGGTIERLRALAGRSYRPQDCGLLGDYSTQIERWVIAGAELLGDRPVAVAIRLPCPACGEQWSYRHSGAEEVRGWALRLTEDGCECSACRAFWAPTEFHWLARLLGCESLPT
jgi:predicted RNA-binding Zn-ribbon protein involved in translation (DUF1610 family)